MGKAFSEDYLKFLNEDNKLQDLKGEETKSGENFQNNITEDNVKHDMIVEQTKDNEIVNSPIGLKQSKNSFKNLYSELNEDYKKKRKIDKKVYLYLIIVLIIVFPIIIRTFMVEYEYIDDITNLPEPLQGPAQGGTIYHANGVDVNIKFVASYEIVGKVISSVEYIGLTPQNNLGPRDFAIGWGIFSEEENINKFTRDSAINRFVYLRYKGSEESFRKEFPSGYPNDQFSNNHVIPSNFKIRQLLKKVKVGDVIQIKGYLVNTSWQEKSLLDGRIYRYSRDSSTIRTDSGGGACEVIYVTDIKRLKQKKK